MTEIRKLAAILVADVVGSPATRHGAAADARSLMQILAGVLA